METAHLHLLFNHLPIIIPFVACCVMLGSFVIQSELVRRVAYAIFILGALGTLPAFFTGEGAEEAIEHLPGMSRAIIHEHEEMAEKFAIASYLLGGLALIGLWMSWKQMRASRFMPYLTMLFSLLIFFLAYQTGLSGGSIRHTEIRSEQATQAQPVEKEED